MENRKKKRRSEGRTTGRLGEIIRAEMERGKKGIVADRMYFFKGPKNLA